MQLQRLRISCDRRGDPAVRKPKTVIAEFNDVLEATDDRNVLAIQYTSIINASQACDFFI